MRALFAIRALPDLCLGIVSGRLETKPLWTVSSFSYLGSPGTPGAFFYSLCIGRHRTRRQAMLGQLVICACRPTWCRWQASARRVPVASRGAYAMRVIAKPRPGATGAGFLRSVRGGVSLPMSCPAITIPVTHVAKRENSTRSVRSVGIPTPPLCLPVQLHLDTPRHCPSFGARLTKHHKIFRALAPAALGRGAGEGGTWQRERRPSTGARMTSRRRRLADRGGSEKICSP